VSSPETGEASERLYQVIFDLPEDIAAWAPGATEKMWVAKTAVKLEVEVRNTPFYFKGVSYLDRVRVRVDHERQELVFDEFVTESGHSTVRVILVDPVVGESLPGVLTGFGCTWEIESSELLWAIDVPPAVEYGRLMAELEKLFDAKKIEIQEAALSKVHGGPLAT
jgi:hypothetical protein